MFVRGEAVGWGRRYHHWGRSRAPGCAGVAPGWCRLGWCWGWCRGWCRGWGGVGAIGAGVSNGVSVRVIYGRMVLVPIM